MISVKRFILLTFGVLASIALAQSLPVKTFALSGSDFQAGRIIDDGIFFNGSGLGTNDIQGFLNAKVPSCDTNGTKIYSGSTTRAQYGASKGYPAPYTCMKDYRQDTPSRAAEVGLCNGFTAGNKSAAQIIYEVGVSCGVSQRVLLILLEKEQSLVTDDWPWSIQYRSATGYGCPDTAPCDAEYYGFFNQVYNAARQFKRYAKYPDSYNYVTARNNYIQYNPNASCGGSNVYIQNQATAGLYNYTPYQPNQSALNNLYGSGDSCGAYGNRNFWRIYNDWFGSTTRFNGSVTLKSGLTLDKPTYSKGDTIVASYVIENSSSINVEVGTVGICARINGQNYDFGTIPVSMGPQSTRTISFSRTINVNGTISVFACAYNEAIGGWVGHFYPYSSDSVARQRDAFIYDNPLITSNLSLSPANPTVNQPVTASFTITNSSSNPVTIQTIGVAARDPSNANVGYPGDSNVTIGANSSYTYSKTRTFTGSPGSYKFFVTSFRNNTWDDNYPASGSGVTRAITATIYDNPIITSGISITPTNPTIMQPVTASFTITNNGSTPVTIAATGIAVRDGSGSNVGYPGDTNVVVPANGTYTYSKTRTFTGSPGSYRFFVTSLRNNTWDDNYPASGSGTQRSVNQFIYDNPLITTSLTLSPANPTLNQPVTASFTITNNSSSPITIPVIGVAVRDGAGNNVGYPGDSNAVIPANGSYTYSKTRSFTSNPGAYRFFITSFRNNTWDDNYPANGPGLVRSLNKQISN